MTSATRRRLIVFACLAVLVVVVRIALEVLWVHTETRLEDFHSRW